MSHKNTKALKERIGKSLAVLPGYLINMIQDGDYLYLSPKGMSVLITCKATHDKNLSFDSLCDSKLDSMLDFSSTSDRTAAYIAIHYYSFGACVLMPISNYIRFTRSSGRSSLPLDDAHSCGIKLKPLDDETFDLSFLSRMQG